MKCTNCGREMSDDARFCEMCGTPVSANKPQAEKTKPAVDPHYDLSVFSDDSDAPTKPLRQAPARDDLVGDDAAKTELLIEHNDDVDDDSAKTVLLPENEIPPVQRDRFEENIAMNRRCRNDETRRDGDYPTEAFHDEYRAYPSAAQNDYRDNYQDSYRAGDPRGDYPDDYRDRNERYNDRYDSRRGGRYADEKTPKNKQKKALIISIIALVLVIAILGGVIFFVNRKNVSAAELQEAKDQYVPPSQAVTIDTSQKDPSNDNIQFKYDDRARIISCSYSAHDKAYEQHYTYHDPERQLEISTTYKDQPVETKVISYDAVKTANDFEDVDGYIVRLDAESLGADNSTTPPTAVPTSAPTESRVITDAQSDEAMKSFLQTFVSCYGFNVGEFEYDCTDQQSTNILEKVCQQFSVADWDLYGSGARVQGWYQSNSNPTGLTPADAPWLDESQINGAMGVVANKCDTADWICTTIFNVDSSNLPSLYEKAFAEQKLWKSEAGIGTSYCAIIYGKGSIGFYVSIRDVKTDGKYYYVTYDRCDPYSKETQETLFAVMEKKNIDGAEYWTMYSNTNNIPAEITPYQPAGR